MSIDQTARVHPDAELADDVEVGAFCVIGPHVRIGAGTRIASHVVIDGHTTLGCDNQVHAFAALGTEPQHRAYKGEPTRLEIGDRNIFREYISVHRGTMLDEGVTQIGSDNLFLAYVHIAHDCMLGDGITMINGATLAGHVRVDDHCILGSYTLVNQFRHIGKLAFLAYRSGAVQDVPAFVRCVESPATPHGINSIGLRRHGYDKQDMAAIKQAYRIVYRSNLRLEQAKAELRPLASENEAVAVMLESLERAGERGIIR